MEAQYPVTFTSCKNDSTMDVFTVQTQNGIIKSFNKLISRDGYWYGEDASDGSSFNFLFDSIDGAFITGSLNDLSTGDVIQFRSYEENLFAFVKNSSEFNED